MHANPEETVSEWVGLTANQHSTEWPEKQAQSPQQLKRADAIYIVPTGASIPTTTKALFPQLPPSPSPSLPSPSAAKQTPWNQLEGLGSAAVSSLSGVWGEAPAEIDFGVFCAQQWLTVYVTMWSPSSNNSCPHKATVVNLSVT